MKRILASLLVVVMLFGFVPFSRTVMYFLGVEDASAVADSESFGKMKKYILDNNIEDDDGVYPYICLEEGSGDNRKKEAVIKFVSEEGEGGLETDVIIINYSSTDSESESYVVLTIFNDTELSNILSVSYCDEKKEFEANAELSLRPEAYNGKNLIFDNVEFYRSQKKISNEKIANALANKYTYSILKEVNSFLDSKIKIDLVDLGFNALGASYKYIKDNSPYYKNFEGLKNFIIKNNEVDEREESYYYCSFSEGEPSNETSVALYYSSSGKSIMLEYNYHGENGGNKGMYFLFFNSPYKNTKAYVFEETSKDRMEANAEVFYPKLYNGDNLRFTNIKDKNDNYTWTPELNKEANKALFDTMTVLNSELEFYTGYSLNDFGFSVYPIKEVDLKYKASTSIANEVNVADYDQIFGECTVEYDSSNKDVATVDGAGNVTAVGRGNATIKCTVKDSKGYIVEIKTIGIKVYFSFFQWLIWIFLFGFSWY